jgi:hypothetical protein
MSSTPEFGQTGCQPIIQFMARAALVTVLLLVAGAAAQTPATAKRITIVLPRGTASETVQITYALEGSFGGHGGFVAALPNVTSYEVPVAADGKIADRVQIVTWIPGCEMRTYDVRPKEPRAREVSVDCTTIPSVTLTGRIRPFTPIAAKPAELVVWYQAWWECDFFGWMDCMVPQYEVANATLEADGKFRLQLPDFSSDPVINSVEVQPGVSGEFRLAVRDPNTWNPIANLKPELPEFGSAGGELKVVSTYPSDLVFIAHSTIP